MVENLLCILWFLVGSVSFALISIKLCGEFTLADVIRTGLAGLAGPFILMFALLYLDEGPVLWKRKDKA